MTGIQCPSAPAYAAMRPRAGRAERLAEAHRDAVAAVQEAIGIPPRRHRRR